ncbi:carboxylesterase family protein [Comamonas sp. JC664]|uniref:carboxylesterase/lipase family protein n=1 Tax=Comamonas sp. JC664 TaxID=2801917 RepID=UPI00174BAB9F|nr:carboxylesterase family protein [Comamonas sp. JC664]MBL0694684.1 carboxylesterase/lipase family protein [Comamonas sp. JC664]GHG94003.1 carboxylic ester hydrolase [Comamonas sp. KCTC 72670]
MSSDVTREVKIKEGTVKGTIEEGIATFRGIPYAEPPVGKLRWSPPVRKKSLGDATFEAFAYGASPLQSRQGCIEGGGGDPGVMSEDCLFLNVWTPSLDETANKPVVVWLYGGAFVVGTGSVPPYNGIPMAQRDVVLVTFNYRVGHLGFFAHPLLNQADGAPQAHANFGLMDQLMVLEWVQDNIAKFGGNPGNVTLVGESAGAKSVLAHFSSPLHAGRTLFHRGIAQSVYVLGEKPLSKAQANGVQFTQDLVTAGLLKEGFTLEELRKVPGDEFWRHSPGTFNAPSPIVGDAVLPKSLRATFETHQQKQLPLIMGSTSNDASVAKAFGMTTDVIINLLKDRKLYDAVKLVYSGVEGDEELARRVVLDFVFAITPKYFGDLHSKKDGGSNKMWRYEFAYVPDALASQQPQGVPHGSDVPYFLGTCERCPPTAEAFNDADRAFAGKVLDYVVSFASAGEPKSAVGGVAWPRHVEALLLPQDRLLLLDAVIAAQSNFKSGLMGLAASAVKMGTFDEVETNVAQVPTFASRGA